MVVARLSLLLRVSRPYYYLVTLWLYLMPTGQRADLFMRVPFWLGLVYCTLPLNAMCYLMNDLSDTDVDAHNARKGGALLGAKENAETLSALVPLVALCQLPFVLAFATLCGASHILPWFLGVFGVNWAYNFGPRLSSNYAPLDLVCPCGYILVVPLSCWLNALPLPPHRSWAHAILLVVRTQLWIQLFDLDADRAAGRRTSAVRIGHRGAQVALLGLLLAETVFVHAHFENWPLRSLSDGSVALFGAQVLLGARRGAASQMSPATINATFLLLGVGGVGLMLRVWSDAAFA